MKEKDGSRIFNTGVFESGGYDKISNRVFYLILGLSVVYGLALTIVIASICSTSFYVEDFFKTMLGGNKILSMLTYLVLFLAIPMAGATISTKSDNPIASFIGYNIIVIPFGFLCSILFWVYETSSIYNIFFITLIASAAMCCLSIMFPRFFSKLGGALFISLIGLLVATFVQNIFFYHMNTGILDYIGALIFSLYIGYDFYRAMDVGKTIDNAIDISVQLYLDILNLFLRLLSILGKKK